MKSLLILCCLLAAATAQDTVDMNQALRNMFEHHINEMDDPMFMEVVEVDAEAGGLVTLVGQIDNLRVEGIHAISLTNVYFNFMSMEIDFDVLVPRIFAQAGQYDLSGRFGGLIPIFGKGPFTVETSNVRVHGTAQLRATDDGFMELGSFRSITSMGSLQTNFENLLLGEELGNLMNYIIGDLVPFTLRNQQQAVTVAVEQIVLEMSKEFLEGMTLEDLIEMLLEFA